MFTLSNTAGRCTIFVEDDEEEAEVEPPPPPAAIYGGAMCADDTAEAGTTAIEVEMTTGPEAAEAAVEAIADASEAVTPPPPGPGPGVAPPPTMLLARADVV